MARSGALLLGTHLAALSSGWDTLASARAVKAALKEAASLQYRLVVSPLQDLESGERVALAACGDPELTDERLESPEVKPRNTVWFHTSLPPAIHLATRPEHARVWLGQALDIVTLAGGSVLCGALGWSPGVGSLRESRRREMGLVIEVLRDLAVEARRRDIRLGIEPANRYETALCNTLAEGVALVEAIGASNVFVMANTLHMQLEESDVHAAIASTGGHLGAVMLAENTGAALGTGAFPWDALWQGLSAIDYAGALVIAPERAAFASQAAFEGRCTAVRALPFLRKGVRSMRARRIPKSNQREEPLASDASPASPAASPSNSSSGTQAKKLNSGRKRYQQE